MFFTRSFKVNFKLISFHTKCNTRRFLEVGCILFRSMDRNKTAQPESVALFPVSPLT